MKRLKPIFVVLLALGATVVAASATARDATRPATIVTFSRFSASASFVVPAAGGTEKLVPSAVGVTWSPDGRRVAGGFIDGKRCRLQVVDLRTAKHTTLKENCNLSGNVDWSPDGKRIAFVSSEKIYVALASGVGKPTKITNGINDSFPRWSPDGRRISYRSLEPGARYVVGEIVTVAPNGSGKQQLIPLAGELDQSDSADWSPDGQKVVFQSKRDEPYGLSGELYVMDADGGNVQRLTTSPGYDGEPAWSPDGSQIAFVSNRGGSRHGDVWVMNADGSNQHRVAADGGYPSWVPAGASTKIH